MIFALEVFWTTRTRCSLGGNWRLALKGQQHPGVSAAFLSACCQPFCHGHSPTRIYAHEILGVGSDKDLKSTQLFLKSQRSPCRKRPHKLCGHPRIPELMREGKGGLSEHDCISSGTIILSRVTPFLPVDIIEDLHKIERVWDHSLQRMKTGAWVS